MRMLGIVNNLFEKISKKVFTTSLRCDKVYSTNKPHQIYGGKKNGTDGQKAHSKEWR